MTTLGEILTIPRFSTIHTLNKQADLSKVVDTIEISETPDVALFLPKNSFLLTTAMVFENDPVGLCEMIQSLHDLPAAGIGIKLGRFLDDIDPMVLAFADNLQFPILQIPSTVTLGTISHQLLSYIWDQQTEKLNYALDIQKKFANMMIKDATLSSLIRHLGSILKRPVLLVDSFMEVVAESRHLKQQPHILAAHFEKMIPKLKEAQKLGKEYSFILESDTEQQLLVSVFPVQTGSYFPYLLVIFKADQIPYPFSQFAIEQANIVLSYTLYKNQKLLEGNLLLREDFFQQLLEATSEEKRLNVLDYGNDYGLKDSNAYQVVLATLQLTLENQTPLKNQSYLAYEWLEKQLSNLIPNALLFPIKNSNYYGILLQDSTNLLTKQLEEIHYQLKKLLPLELHFFIGNTVSDLNALHFSYNEALEIFQQQDGARPHSSILNYYQLKGINKLLDYVPKNEIDHFCTIYLKTLAFPKEDTLIELRKTLKIYLECQCEITETSKRLFIHRNTVKYRIAKCEDLFQMPINDPDFSLKVRLALVLSEPKNE